MVNTAGKNEMKDGQDLRSPSGRHAALLIRLVQSMDHPVYPEINSAAFLLQEWLGVPTRFIFPMAGGRTLSGNLKDLLLGKMTADMVLDHPGRMLASPLQLGHHAETALLRNQDFLDQYPEQIDLVLEMTREIPARERNDLSALIWLLRRNPGIGHEGLTRTHQGLWKDLPGFPHPHDRTQSALNHLREFNQRAAAGGRGLEPLAAMPEHRDSIPAGPRTCPTHREAYNLETQGRRLHIIQEHGALMACWENDRGTTPVLVEPPPGHLLHEERE